MGGGDHQTQQWSHTIHTHTHTTLVSSILTNIEYKCVCRGFNILSANSWRPPSKHTEDSIPERRQQERNNTFSILVSSSRRHCYVFVCSVLCFTLCPALFREPLLFDSLISWLLPRWPKSLLILISDLYPIKTVIDFGCLSRMLERMWKLVTFRFLMKFSHSRTLHIAENAMTVCNRGT